VVPPELGYREVVADMLVTAVRLDLEEGEPRRAARLAGASTLSSGEAAWACS
jgi:hypothetical protein